MPSSDDSASDRVLRRIESSGNRTDELFRHFVIKLLQHHAAAENKPLKVVEPGEGSDEAGVFVARLPAGLEELPGPAAVSVSSSAGQPPSRGLRRLLERSVFQAVVEGAAAVLVIHLWPVGLEERALAETRSSAPSVMLWGRERLVELLERYPAVADEVPEEEPIAGLKQVLSLGVEDAEEQWQVERRQRLEELQGIYAERRLTLFLGAGVSQSEGLPSWNSLIDGLAVSLVMKQLSDVDVSDEEVVSLADRVRELSGGSPLMSGRYLRRGLTRGVTSDLDPRSFEGLVPMLYRRSAQRGGRPRSLLEEIADACRPPGSEPKIRAVVTFNFDDLLEEELKRRSIGHRSIFREGQSADPEELPIYHVHGFLPRHPGDYDGIENADLAFSEEGYHRMFADPFHWSNLVQLNHLREGPCLMLGLSMTDPNLRRLLEVAARGLDDSRHYVFMKRLTLDEFLRTKDGKRVELRREPAEAFLRSHHSLQESLFGELRTKIVWFKSFEELSGDVRMLRE